MMVPAPMIANTPAAMLATAKRLRFLTIDDGAARLGSNAVVTDATRGKRPRTAGRLVDSGSGFKRACCVCPSRRTSWSGAGCGGSAVLESGEAVSDGITARLVRDRLSRIVLWFDATPAVGPEGSGGAIAASTVGLLRSPEGWSIR